MTRINTNINSLTAQQNLAKTSVLLQTALTRLSTGLRINSGKDDPAGMIAAAQLGSDIAGTNAAIGNSKMAQQIIDTADAALGQITGLVNDIRTLVTQAANSAAMSPDQIAANQLQINSSLNAINQISQSTNFQGRKLLDGSLDFTTTHNINDLVSHYSAVQNLEIDSANPGTAANIPVTVSVANQAQRAYLATSTTTTNASDGSFTITTSNGSFNIAPPTGGLNYNGMTVKFATSSGQGAGTAYANYVTATKTLTITMNDTNVTSFAVIQGALAITQVDGANPTVNFVASGATAGVQFDPAKDTTNINVAAVASNGFMSGLTNGGIIQITAKTGGTAGNISARIIADASTTTTYATMGNATNLVVHIGTNGGEDTVAKVAAAITSGTNYTATALQGGATAIAGADEDTASSLTELLGATPAVSNTIFTSKQGNIAGSVEIKAGTTGVSLDGTDGHLIITIDVTDAVHDMAWLLGQINGLAGSKVSAAAGAGYVGTTKMNAIGAITPANTTLAPGANGLGKADLTGGTDAKTAVTSVLNIGGTPLTEDVQFMATGNAGSHLFKFTTGTALSLVRDAVNALSDGTGVTSRITLGATTTNLIFESSDFGSAGTVGIDVRSGGAAFKNNMVDRTGVNTVYSAGTDINAKVNGVQANGVGNTLSIDTPALAMSMTVNDPTDLVPTPSTISFTITGGGAHFQIGPDVVSTQQAIIGIQSVDTANMNTSYGRLYELHSGEDAALTTDATKAGKIITAIAGKISTLRGRLGAFSKTTLDSNIATLGSTVNALTNAQSSIQDADFAAETASLTRAQVLTQSGTAVLQLANRGPQQVLALLQNL